MKNKYLCLSLLLLMIGLGSQCKKKCYDLSNPDCENYDPCFSKQATNADFKIEELVGSHWFETDSVNGRLNTIRFTATQTAASYTWLIGSEVIHDKSFTRTRFPANRWINITLIIQRTPDKQCFPNDDGIDTLVKKMYVWHDEIEWDPTLSYRMLVHPFPVYGTYYGALKSAPYSKFYATVMDTNWMQSTNAPYIVEVLRGIPYPPDFASDKLSRDLSDGSFFNGWSPKALSIESIEWGTRFNSRIPAMKGFAWLSKNDINSITIAYRFQDTLTRAWSPQDTFRGTRVW
jgi:hypothetical protein